MTFVPTGSVDALYMRRRRPARAVPVQDTDRAEVVDWK
jgi:hypothetical protein